MDLNHWEIGILAGLFFGILCMPFGRTRWGDAGWKTGGVLFMLCLLGNHAERYLRGYWHLNAHLVPVPIIGPDGRHMDGTPVNNIERMESQGGNNRDAVFWLWWTGIGAANAYLWRKIRMAEEERRQGQERLEKLRRVVRAMRDEASPRPGNGRNQGDTR